MPAHSQKPSLISDDPIEVLDALRRALGDDGPAVAPVGAGPDRDRMIAALQPDVALEMDGIAAVLMTSGSTGPPKGVLLSAAALTHSARATEARLGGPGQWLLTLPADRIAGVQVLVRSWLAGTDPIVTTGKFTAEAFRAAATRLDPGQRRYTSLVPTQLDRLLSDGAVAVDALSGFDAVLVGGGPVGDRLLERARGAGVRVIATYGMTETCGGCVYDGTPLDGVRVELAAAAGADAGRIRVAGPVLFSGYRGDPEATARALSDGWHTTPDLGRIDENGRLEVLGRDDDVVISGGVNVPLPLVEDAVAALPEVERAAVVGVPDPVWGARVVAYVVPRRGAEPPSLPRIREHVAARHPRAWAPRRLVIVESLPELPSGKLDRAALRAGLEHDEP